MSAILLALLGAATISQGEKKHQTQFFEPSEITPAPIMSPSIEPTSFSIQSEEFGGEYISPRGHAPSSAAPTTAAVIPENVAAAMGLPQLIPPILTITETGPAAFAEAQAIDLSLRSDPRLQVIVADVSRVPAGVRVSTYEAAKLLSDPTYTLYSEVKPFVENPEDIAQRSRRAEFRGG